MGYACLRLSKVVVEVRGRRGSSAESNVLGYAALSGLESELSLCSDGSFM
jgi:hypothetical protein